MSETEPLTAFVNERRVSVPAPATALDAVRAFDPGLAAALLEGRAYLTDGRGVRRGADQQIVQGDILRVVSRARRLPEADAHS